MVVEGEGGVECVGSGPSHCSDGLLMINNRLYALSSLLTPHSHAVIVATSRHILPTAIEPYTVDIAHMASQLPRLFTAAAAQIVQEHAALSPYRAEHTITATTPVSVYDRAAVHQPLLNKLARVSPYADGLINAGRQQSITRTIPPHQRDGCRMMADAVRHIALG